MPSDKLLDLDFRRSRIIKGHGLAERLRAARGVPQAIVKVISFTNGPGEVMGQISYISRKGKLEIETDSGQVLTTWEEQKDLVWKWARDFDDYKNSRDTVHMVFSMPHGSSVKALRDSVRKVLAQEFPGHEAVFAIHEDTDNPHAHVVLKMRGRGKKSKLALKREDLHRLREVFAEIALEEGVEMAVSPRAARGVGRKAQRQVAYHLHKKGVVPKTEKRIAQETLDEATRGTFQERPWEIAMFRRNKAERQAYFQDAETLRALAPQQEKQTQEAMLRAATDLERFAKTMPTPKTLRQMMWEQLQGSSRRKPNPQDQTKAPDIQTELDR